MRRPRPSASSLQREEAADVDHAVLLGAHGAAVGAAGTSPGRCSRASGRACPGSRSLMNMAFSAKRQTSRIERLAVALAAARVGAHVGQGHRLAAAGVVGDGDHAERDALGRRARAAPPPRSRSMLPLNGWMVARLRCPRGSPGPPPRRPSNSMLARVVSKWVLLGTRSPRLAATT